MSSSRTPRQPRTSSTRRWLRTWMSNAKTCRDTSCMSMLGSGQPSRGGECSSPPWMLDRLRKYLRGPGPGT
eukprot:5699115-Lingulodinium_polyedra.AAC.1